MAESPPPSSPVPPHPPNKFQDLDSQNPNPSSESEDPSHTHQPQTPETLNPPAQIPVDLQEQPNESQDQREETLIVTDDLEQEQDDAEEEQEGMSLTLSPRPQSSISDTHSALESKGGYPSVSSARRGPKRKKGMARLSKKSKVALEKKLQTLKQNFNPIPFVPGKALDFSRHEENLKHLGLWEFAQIEFDRSLRVDLLAKLIVNYTPKQRFFYVDDCRIGVNRAELGRALKLPMKKSAGDCDGEEFPAEFLSFLNEFVSNWMLLHEDSWITPSEVVNWLNMIKDGHPEKVDWAGLVWFMVEKELAQGLNLNDCYYASHLQLLMKMQKEELFRENPKVDLTVEDDEDGDVKMLDSEEFSLGGQKLVEQNVEVSHGEDCVEVSHGQDCVAPLDVGGDANEVEKVDDTEKVEEVGNADKVEKVEDVDRVENVGGAQIVASVNEVCMAENVESAECVQNVVNADKHVQNVDIADELVQNADVAGEHVKNVDVIDDCVENVDTVDEHVEVFDNNENVEDESNMMDYSFCKGQEQGNWLLEGKNDGGQHFLQRCNVGDAKLSIEDSRQDGVGKGIKHEDVEDDGHVEGFRIMQKGPLDGISQANLMHAFEVGQLQYPSSDLGGQTSLELMSSRVENNVMLGGPSMFNHVGKREIDHEDDIGHHAFNDGHKKMRIDGQWGHKSSEFDMVMDQILHMVGKAKMVHEAEKEEAYEQGSVNQQFIAHEMARKDNEIMQLRCKLDEQERRHQAQIHRLDRELYLMNSVITGYRKALKDSQRQFAEYRKRCGIHDEPVYKDAGSGGVVKSIMELERERLKQEQERKIICYYLEEEYKKQMKDYELKWQELFDKVRSLDARLLTAAGEVEVVKEWIVKRKTCGSAENETEDK